MNENCMVSSVRVKFTSRTIRHSLISGILTIIVIILFFYGTASAESAITRTNDYIIVYGKELTHNLNKKINGLSLFAFTKGKFQPVPFQVDEIDPAGEWVLTSIPECLKDEIQPDMDKDSGLLDENDELVFMIRDAGARAGKSLFPKDAGPADEIELTDPVTGSRVWIYLFSFSANPPASTVDYIKCDPLKGQILTDSYDLKFQDDLPAFPSYLSIRGSENIIDRVKLRVKVKIFGIPFTLDESNLISKVSLYKDGPIRTIRRTRNTIKFMGIFRTPSAGVEMVSYNKICILPMRVQIPFSIKSFKSVFSSKIRAGADFCNDHGWKFKTNTHRNWINIDGKMDDEENAMNGEPLSWFALAGDGKAFIVRLIIDRKPDGSKQDSPFNPTLYYMDNDKAADPPEFVPGQSPNVNYWMNGFEDLTKGTLYFYAIFYIMDNYADGMENKYLQILDNPVKISVNPSETKKQDAKYGR